MGFIGMFNQGPHRTRTPYKDSDAVFGGREILQSRHGLTVVSIKGEDSTT